MAHLLSFIDTRPQFETPQPPEPHSQPEPPSLLPTKSINVSHKSALLVESDPARTGVVSNSTDRSPQFETPQPPEPHSQPEPPSLLPTKSINVSHKSALLVESD